MYANCVLWPHRERSDNVLEMQVSTLGKLGSYAEDNLYYNLTYLTHHLVFRGIKGNLCLVTVEALSHWMDTS